MGTTVTPARTWMPLIGLAVLALAVGLIALAQRGQGIPGELDRFREPGDTVQGTAGTGGDLGAVRPTSEEGGGSDAGVTGEVDPPSTIREVELITGALDGHELVGRRVELEVPLLSRAGSEGVFWVGPSDNPLLVVIARDTRTDSRKRAGDPADPGIEPLTSGTLLISGRIQKVPAAEQRLSWNLTRADVQRLDQRPIYLRADSVRPLDVPR